MAGEAKLALWVRLEAKAGREKDLESFLRASHLR